MSIINCSKCNATRNTDISPNCTFCEDNLKKSNQFNDIPMRIIPHDPIPKTFGEVPDNMVVKLAGGGTKLYFRCNSTVFVLDITGIQVWDGTRSVINKTRVLSVIGKIVYSVA